MKDHYEDFLIKIYNTTIFVSYNNEPNHIVSSHIEPRCTTHRRSQAQARAACEEDQKFLLELPDAKTSELADRFILEYFPDHFVFMNAYVEDSKWSWVNGKPSETASL